MSRKGDPPVGTHAVSIAEASWGALAGERSFNWHVSGEAADRRESSNEKQEGRTTGVAGGKTRPASTDLASPGDNLMDQTWKLTGNPRNDGVRGKTGGSP